MMLLTNVTSINLIKRLAERITEPSITMLRVFMSECVCVRCHLYKTITPIPMGFVFPGNVWQDGSHRTKLSMTFQVLELVEK